MREQLSLLYVDDNLEDGEESDVQWVSDEMDNRFDCKDTKWIEPMNESDLLGLTVSMDADYIYVSMGDYIRKCLKALDWGRFR